MFDVDLPYKGKVFKMPSGQLRIIEDHCSLILPQKFVPTISIEDALGDGGPGTVVGEMEKKGYYLKMKYNPLSNLWKASFLEKS